MVFLAILRDPPFVHGRLRPPCEAVGRAGDVPVDPAAVPPSLARQVAGAVGKLSSGVQAVLLAARRRCRHPGLCWRGANQPGTDRARPGGGGLLLPALPRDPAAGLGVRNAAAAAELDLGERAAW